MNEHPISRRNAIIYMASMVSVAATVGAVAAQAEQETPITNGSFETGFLMPWHITQGTAQVLSGHAHNGSQALALGPGPSSVEQSISVRPNAAYCLTGWLQSGSGAEEVRLGIKGDAKFAQETAVPQVTYTQASIDFETGPQSRQVTVYLLHPKGSSVCYADGLELRYVGQAESDAVVKGTNSITILPGRTAKTDMGVAQQPNDALRWLLDAKFGMFIHWGLYSGPGKGEWYMHNAGILPADYRKYAFPESGDEYFAADKYDPSHWVAVAKAAGMKWMCLTARHHDGFCLFDSPHPNAFTSVQTLKRDLVSEYVHAVRQANLKVGIYYSPLSWRYPGYYDVTGTKCAPNPFGYTTDLAHKKNARVMKEENYANVKHLMTAYGKIDHIYWDGGWLAEQGSDADAAFFHEPGRFRDPTNAWPVAAPYAETDEVGHLLGVMGTVRRHQPQVIVNPRYGWTGDVREEEGGAVVTGPIRSTDQWDKNLTMQGGGWGYNTAAIARGDVFSRDQIIDYLANCVVRNMVMLLNFGPDRHGQMPPLIEQRLCDVGHWLEATGEAIYGTRGGPWQPKDSQYGFCHKDDTLYAHLLQGHSGDVFALPPVGALRPLKAYDVFTKKPLPFTVGSDRSVQIRGIDRKTNPVDTIIAIRFDKDVMTYAQKT